MIYRYLGITLDMDLLPSYYKVFTAFMIIAGFWFVSKLYWMAVYQYRYGGNYGAIYLSGALTKEKKKYLKWRLKTYGRKSFHYGRN